MAVKKCEDVGDDIEDFTFRSKRLLKKCAYALISHQELSAQHVVAYRFTAVIAAVSGYTTFHVQSFKGGVTFGTSMFLPPADRKPKNVYATPVQGLGLRQEVNGKLKQKTGCGVLGMVVLTGPSEQFSDTPFQEGPEAFGVDRVQIWGEVARGEDGNKDEKEERR